MESNIFKYCKFYKGQDTNPYDTKDPRYTYWNMECAWVKVVSPCKSIANDYGFNFTIDFSTSLDDIDVPFFLKATIYNVLFRCECTEDDMRVFLNNYLNTD